MQLKPISVRTACYFMSASFFLTGALGEWSNLHPMALHPSNWPVFNVVVGLALLLAAKILPLTPAPKK